VGTLFLHAEAGEQFGYLASGIIISLVVLLTALLLGSIGFAAIAPYFFQPHP